MLTDEEIKELAQQMFTILKTDCRQTRIRKKKQQDHYIREMIKQRDNIDR
jgi:hypothetical protein